MHRTFAPGLAIIVVLFGTSSCQAFRRSFTFGLRAPGLGSLCSSAALGRRGDHSLSQEARQW